MNFMKCDGYESNVFYASFSHNCLALSVGKKTCYSLYDIESVQKLKQVGYFAISINYYSNLKIWFWLKENYNNIIYNTKFGLEKLVQIATIIFSKWLLTLLNNFF